MVEAYPRSMDRVWKIIRKFYEGKEEARSLIEVMEQIKKQVHRRVANSMSGDDSCEKKEKKVRKD